LTFAVAVEASLDPPPPPPPATVIGTAIDVPVSAPARVSVVGPPGVPAGRTTSTDALPTVSNPGNAGWAALSSVAVPSVVVPSFTVTAASLVSRALVIDQDDTSNFT